MDRILQMVSGRWLVHRDTAVSYLPMLIAFLNGSENIASIMTKEEADKLSKPRILAIGTQPGKLVQYDFGDPCIPDNSIAVIPIQGTILPWSSMRIYQAVQLAEDNENIISILFPTNSPGGMVNFTDILANEIKNCKKPTVAVVQNMSASAAMWLISAMDYRITTSPMDFIGSIGVFTSYTDMSVLLKEKLGISITDIYATKSTRKNEMTRLFLEGNTQPIIDDLDFVNEIFHATIQKNLGLKADSEVFTGAIFNAPQAIDLGLINEINTMDYAIEYVYNQGLTSKINKYKSSI